MGGVSVNFFKSLIPNTIKKITQKESNNRGFLWVSLILAVSFVIVGEKSNAGLNSCTPMLDSSTLPWFKEAPSRNLSDFKVFSTYETKDPRDGVLFLAYREVLNPPFFMRVDQEKAKAGDPVRVIEPRRLVLGWVTADGKLTELPFAESQILGLQRRNDGEVISGLLRLKTHNDNLINLSFYKDVLTIGEVGRPIITYERSAPAVFNTNLDQYVSTRTRVAHLPSKTGIHSNYYPMEVHLQRGPNFNPNDVSDPNNYVYSIATSDHMHPFIIFLIEKVDERLSALPSIKKHYLKHLGQTPP